MRGINLKLHVDCVLDAKQRKVLSTEPNLSVFVKCILKEYAIAQ